MQAIKNEREGIVLWSQTISMDWITKPLGMNQTKRFTDSFLNQDPY